MNIKNNLPENVQKAVEQLWTYSHLTPENNTVIREYLIELETEKDEIKFLDKMEFLPADAKRLTEIEEELKWFDDNVQLYRNTRISILEMNQKVRHLWDNSDDKYFDGFFDFKELVEMINCYFDISEPYKPSNKIAYGWNFSLEKGWKAFRPYLFACIRNYLNKNGVNFETKDLQKICNLKDIEDEDC